MSDFHLWLLVMFLAGVFVGIVICCLQDWWNA